MSQILTIVGATGAQGGSIVTSALKSGDYKVRGITRNVENASAKTLTAQAVEMVAADTSDMASLVKASEGSHAIFVVTDFFAPVFGAEETVTIESTQGIPNNPPSTLSICIDSRVCSFQLFGYVLSLPPCSPLTYSSS
ncbi:uncharacterized protein EAF01_011776 [Botrytis porri]|uniref:uncharacterized protein n=1 Tax=Botrytis porri TaxID=87229 RepID=UPI0018FF7A03|nr:uncharacterized protein EAF01_011776 [Botrytis porri]KAF7881996.1 hypothetical protein EAF01_011776 [Botrytis porri]